LRPGGIFRTTLPFPSNAFRKVSDARAMAETSAAHRLAVRAARSTSPAMATAVRGLSDRTVAWAFIMPTLLLLLAINIGPLLWTLYLSFTDFAADRPGRPVAWIGTRNYERLLSDGDIWPTLQATARFLFWTLALQVLIGFALAWLINRRFRGHGFWTMVIVLPMMLSPAVVGNFWTYLYLPQSGLTNFIVSVFTGIDPSSFDMTGSADLAPWSIIIVDTWMWTPFVMLICLAGLRSIPDALYEAAEIDRASPWRQFRTITIPMVLPFLTLAVLFRGIENFRMFDLVVELTAGGPGPATGLASITLKREAFETWRTGYASAFAVILFVIVFGAAGLYVKALNRVRQG
jgi:multiple sugar transport system permease protein